MSTQNAVKQFKSDLVNNNYDFDFDINETTYMGSNYEVKINFDYDYRIEEYGDGWETPYIKEFVVTDLKITYVTLSDEDNNEIDLKLSKDEEDIIKYDITEYIKEYLTHNN